MYNRERQERMKPVNTQRRGEVLLFLHTDLPLVNIASSTEALFTFSNWNITVATTAL